MYKTLGRLFLVHHANIDILKSLINIKCMAEYQILRTWEVETSINQLLHQASGEYYNNLNFIFMLPSIIMSSAMGTLGLINTSSSDSEGILAVNILITCFGFLTAALTMTHNFLNIQSLQTTHSFHAAEYSKISREIKMHIYLSQTKVKVYANIAEYIKSCRTRIDKLIESAHDIPVHIEAKMSAKIDEIRRQELAEVNELIALSNRNHEELRQHNVNIDDLCALSEVHVLGERRSESPNNDEVKKPEDDSDEDIRILNRRKSNESDESNESDKSNGLIKSALAKMSSLYTPASIGTSNDVQTRLSLDVFYKHRNNNAGKGECDAGELLSRNTKRQSWRSNLNLD